MDDKILTEENTEEFTEKKHFIAWLNEHKFQLILAGISLTAILATVLGLKNKDAITELWNTIKIEMKNGSLYSIKWFENASLEELEKNRELVRLDYNNPNLDSDYRSKCWNLLSRFDNAIRKIKWDGIDNGYPVHSDGGWYLPSDD